MDGYGYPMRSDRTIGETAQECAESFLFDRARELTEPEKGYLVDALAMLWAFTHRSTTTEQEEFLGLAIFALENLSQEDTI